MASCKNKRFCGALVLIVAASVTGLWAVLKRNDFFESKPSPVKVVKKKPTKSSKKKLDSSAIAKELVAMTGGKQVKAVWVESRDPAKTDTFARGKELH